MYCTSHAEAIQPIAGEKGQLERLYTVILGNTHGLLFHLDVQVTFLTSFPCVAIGQFHQDWWNSILIHKERNIVYYILGRFSVH